MTRDRAKAAIKAKMEESMFKHLTAQLDPSLKKKIPVAVLRELLSCLGEWAYVERNKWLVGLSETIRQRAAGKEPPPPAPGQELKERLKPDGERTTFLDALDEIR